jgi:ribosome-associated translation inhibitor RaiA
MSDTPRTDAFIDSKYVAFDAMWIDFARRLERDLNREKSRRETDKKHPDTKRINWLGSAVEHFGRDIGFHWDHEDGFWFATFDRGTSGGIPLDSATKNKSVRAAIDAAMRESAP